MDNFLNKYFIGFHNIIDVFLTDSDNKKQLNIAVEMLKETKDLHSSILLIGNGGSSAIAEHMAIDFTKNAGLRAYAISGSSMLTTFSNDYGFEKVFQKAVEHFGNKGDILIAISSSGTSANILNACVEARDNQIQIITFSGFDKDNPLRSMGDLNFWVDSWAFGYVELVHNLLIHYLNDAIIGKVEYMIR